MGSSGDVSHAAGWAAHECVVTYDWQGEDGPIHLAFSRRSSGEVVAAAFTLDLRGPGLVGARSAEKLNEEGWSAWIDRHFKGQMYMPCEPALARKILEVAIERGNPPPQAAINAMTLFGEIDSSAIDEEILWGERKD